MLKSDLRNFSIIFLLRFFLLMWMGGLVRLKFTSYLVLYLKFLSLYICTHTYIYNCRIYSWNVNSLYFYFLYCLLCASGIRKNQLKSCKIRPVLITGICSYRKYILNRSIYLHQNLFGSFFSPPLKQYHYFNASTSVII